MWLALPPQCKQKVSAAYPCFPVYNVSIFLGCFLDFFFFPLDFSNYTIKLSENLFLMFILFGVCFTSWTSGFAVFIKSGKIPSILLNIFFLHILYSESPNTLILIRFDIIPHAIEAPFLFSAFFLFRLQFRVSTAMCLVSQFCCFAVSTAC